MSDKISIEKYHTGYRKWMLIISILLLNIVDQCAGAISAAIPAMAKTFQGYSITQVELATTIVSITSTVFVLASGFITLKIGQKQTAALGLIICAISSLIPVFSNSYIVVIISRLFLGVGIGLTNPLAVSLISTFFIGDTRSNLLGWRSAVGGAGQSLMTLAAGYLLKISWHAAFWVYLLFIPTLILFLIFVPQPEQFATQTTKNKQSSVDNKQVQSEKKNNIWVIIGLSLLLFAVMSLMMISFIKIGELYIENHIGSLTEASTALSIFTGFQIVGGILYGPSYKLLKDNVIYVGILGTGIPLIFLGAAHNTALVYTMFAIIGILGGLGIPWIFTKVAQFTTERVAPLYNGIVLVGSQLGSFIAPFLGNLLGGKSAFLAVINSGYANIALAIILAIIMVIIKRRSAKAA